MILNKLSKSYAFDVGQKLFVIPNKKSIDGNVLQLLLFLFIVPTHLGFLYSTTIHTFNFTKLFNYIKSNFLLKNEFHQIHINTLMQFQKPNTVSNLNLLN